LHPSQTPVESGLCHSKARRHSRSLVDDAEALKSYTWNGAYAAREESLKGSIVPGKLADITVLSKDIMTVAEDEIPSTTVVYTIVGGKVAYSRP
jgi:hypothetical protein